MTRHQYGISTVVAQTSFRGETSGGDSKCDCFLRLSFSQIAANVSRIFKKFYKSEPDRLSMNVLVDFCLMWLSLVLICWQKSLPLFLKLLVNSGDTTAVAL